MPTAEPLDRGYSEANWEKNKNENQESHEDLGALEGVCVVLFWGEEDHSGRNQTGAMVQFFSII